MEPASGPTVLGVDVMMVATMLAAVATFAVLIAIYAATTVKDPMAKRVRALNDRREQLKAGIVASTNKRRRNITNKNEMGDKVRGLLGSLKMLQAEQVEKAQRKLMQAGIRSKDLAFVVIFARFVLPMVLGTIMIVGVYLLDWFPEWGSFKRYAVVAGTLIGSYKAPDIWLKNKITKRTAAVRKGLPGRARPARHLRRGRPHRRRRLQPSRARARQGLSRARRRVRPHLDRARLPHRPPQRVREPRQPHRPRIGARRRHHHDPDGKVRHAAGQRASRPFGRVPQRADDARRGESGTAAGDHDGAAHPLHPAGAVRRHPRPGGLLDLRQPHGIKSRGRNNPPLWPIQDARLSTREDACRDRQLQRMGDLRPRLPARPRHRHGADGGGKWKRRYKEEIRLRKDDQRRYADLETENKRLLSERGEMDTLRHAAARDDAARRHDGPGPL
jgi:hypothetical protein